MMKIPMSFNAHTEINRISAWLRDQLGEETAVIGLSGGVDSSVVAYLAAAAVGAERVQGLIMPSPTTPSADMDDAIAVATGLGVSYDVMQLAPLMEAALAASSDFNQSHAAANLQSRLRMLLLYGRANACSGRVVGTGNRSELLTGYFTKYGDGGVDLLPIGHLYKTEVWQLALELGVPEQIINKAPSAGLHAGQTDEADLGLSYTELDLILEALTASDVEALHSTPLRDGLDASQVTRIQQLLTTTNHKRALPPMLARSDDSLL